ncbi:MAG: RNA polymerase subunit sigma [Anaerolineales bacterium]|nr:MAG: RNA polymerase subunit sigma [Anaerolineales bacterium]
MSEPALVNLETITLAAQLITQSHKTVTLTGAGISTRSGIPDFRSPGTGLWQRVEPMEVASLSAFRHNPEMFFEWFHPLAVMMYAAKPNPAHIALAKLQAAGYMSEIITQNIDGLHSRAGAENVLEVHGSLRSMSCTNCYLQVPSATILEDYLMKCTIPTCPDCGSILKPDVILYEEQLPVKTWIKAEEACKHCELLLVAGTSLEVMPSAKLPVQALEHGSKLIIINNAPTFMDVRADLVIRADVAEILPKIQEEVLNTGFIPQGRI